MPTDLDQLASSMPFARDLGLELTHAEPSRVCGTMPWAPERCTAGGVLHGGALMAFADSLGAVCAFLNLPAEAATSTIESKTNFFRAVPEGTVNGAASPVHVGRSTIVIQTECRDDRERLVSLTLQTQAILL
jgi:uncharacterized protein (TIGR00369 family)